MKNTLKLVPVTQNQTTLAELAVQINAELTALDAISEPGYKTRERLIELFSLRDSLTAIIQSLES